MRRSRAKQAEAEHHAPREQRRTRLALRDKENMVRLATAKVRATVVEARALVRAGAAALAGAGAVERKAALEGAWDTTVAIVGRPDAAAALLAGGLGARECQGIAAAQRRALGLHRGPARGLRNLGVDGPMYWAPCSDNRAR